MAATIPTNEIEVFQQLICGFIGGILRRASEIPEDKWNWSFSERTPTAREICEHSWMWLWTDRQQVTVSATTKHIAVPDLPENRLQMLELLESERGAWHELLQSLTSESLDEIRHTSDGEERSIRGFCYHMAQHIVSKSGQMTMLYFELGLDGGEPYDAPHPNRVFELGSPDWPAKRI